VVPDHSKKNGTFEKSENTNQTTQGRIAEDLISEEKRYEERKYHRI